MQAPAIPSDEKERLAALRRLNLLDSPLEGRFERITHHLGRALNVPVALFTLIDQDRQWFKSAYGFDKTDGERQYSMCAHVINEDDMLVVPNISQDERFFDNPGVLGNPNFNFYAGQPVHSPDGRKIGALCAIDTKARELKQDEADLLRYMAQLIEGELKKDVLSSSQAEFLNELHVMQRIALVDPVTRLWNKDAMTEILRREIRRARKTRKPLSIATIHVKPLSQIKLFHGAQSSDIVIKNIAQQILLEIPDNAAVGRIGNDCFLAILPNTNDSDANKTIHTACQLIGARDIALPTGSVHVMLESDIKTIVPTIFTSVKRLLKNAA